MKRQGLIASYDIKNDALRNKIAKKLKDLGMKRVQGSVFWGEIPEIRVRQVESLATYAKGTDRMLVVPLCSSCLGKLSTHGDDPGPRGTREVETW